MRSVLAAVALLAGGPALAQDAPIDQGPLAAAIPVERDLAPRASHVFTVALEPDRTYAIDVEQLQTYLAATWTAEGQTRRVNDRSGRSGREEVFWVSAKAGEATLTVRNLGSRAGRYRVTLAAPSTATTADRERHQAERDTNSPDLALRRAGADRFGALGLVHRHIRTLDRMSYLAAAQGAFAPARQAAEECVALARAASLEEELSSCLCALASTSEKAGDLDRATELYAEAIAMRETRGDPGPLAAALNDAANVRVVRGDYDGAEALITRGIGLAGEAGDEMAGAILQFGMGALSAYRGDMESALAAFETSAAVARRLGNVNAEVTSLVNISVAYGNLGDIERSLARGREAAARAEAANLKPLLALARLTLGGEHDDAGDLEAAERELAAGVAIGQEIHDPLSIARGSALLGWVLAQRGDAAGAEAQLAAAVAAAREAGARAEEATALLYLGKARLLSGRLDDAEASLAQARTTCEALGRTEDLGQVLTAQARLSLARGDLGAATERIDGALGHFESVRTRVALADRRARYAAFRREAYDVAVAVRLARDAREPGQGHRAAAFDLTERARARSLQEELAARRGASSAVPDDLSLRHRRALDRIGHVQRKLVDGHTSAQPDERALAGLERDLAAAVASEEEVRREIRRLTPRRAPDDQSAPTAAAIAARLGRDEALLEYHVGANASWLFVVTRAGLEVATLPGARTLREQVDALRGLLAAPRTLGATQYATAGHAAYRTLVAPALEGRPHLRRLRIVPDGPLWEIPFEALLTAPARGGGYASLPYLLRRFTVSYQPSADAPARPEAAGRRAELVAFADPRLPDGARAPESLARVERAVFREGARWSLAPLPCARQEARDVAALFGAQRARVHLGEGARESRVKSDPDVAGARYLLFSTHALVSETMPSQSALVLSLGADGGEDGLLQAYEIDGMRLEAELVVLSACETALGQNVRGEGLLGLSRAFFHAGARRLLASQWRVADCSTAELTTELFRRLLANEGTADPAEALRRAKLKLLSRPASAHPYFWAPFVLVG